MANYQSPGVYVKEVSSGIKPIAGVGTSTGAFVGIAEKGEIGKAVLVTNWSQFVKEFGYFTPNAYLAYAIHSFFAEGGTSCYVVRTAKDSVSSTKTVNDKDGDDADPVLKVTACSSGTWGDRITVEIADLTDTDTTHFKLTVNYEEEKVEVFDNLTGDIKDKINENSDFIRVNVLDSAKRPVNGTYKLTDGANGAEGADFEGDDNNKMGLHAFDIIDDINIVAIPDKAGDRDVILKGLIYCEDRKDCFFIADTLPKLEPKMVVDFKNGTTNGGNAFNSSYGALYYPWVYVSDPLIKGERKLIPPSGAVAGSYAHTDASRGVHKAPAGTSDGHLGSVVDIEKTITVGEHDTLNPEGINAIRTLPRSGICLWGAQTLSADPEWKYINIRRLFLFIEESIEEATQWIVFEPNDPSLWGKVIRNITAFLLRLWRDGALFGSTPEKAFFVKVDAENNPQEVRDAGELIIEIGVAPVKPAEFVIIKISQKTLSK